MAYTVEHPGLSQLVSISGPDVFVTNAAAITWGRNYNFGDNASVMGSSRLGRHSGNCSEEYHRDKTGFHVGIIDAGGNRARRPQDKKTR